MRPLVLLAVLGVLLAGCTSTPPPEETTTSSFTSDEGAADGTGTEPASDEAAAETSGSAPTEAPAPTGDAPPALPTAEIPHHVDRLSLEPGGKAEFRFSCPGACPDLRFFFGKGEGALLELRMTWNGTRTRGVGMELVTPEGVVLPGERGFDAARVLVSDPAEGDYVLRASGVADVTLRVRAWEKGASRGEGADLLPNLVTLVPADVGVADCDPWERVEQEAATCLRLGNAIGNAGDGPLEVALAPDQGLATPLGGGKFVQRIFQAKGAPREASVGAAAFHPTHAHFHYDGIARFSLHAVDPSTGLRGAEVAAHHKAGFCLIDVGKMEEPDAQGERDPPSILDMGCVVPTAQDGWVMGVSRGYYDLYDAGLTDQYVEISGVEDGTYELVSVCNWAGSLLELDAGNNVASVLLRLEGDQATVLEERGFYRVPE